MGSAIIQKGTTHVLFSCTGVGIFNRGIESFFREAFDGLKTTPGLAACLIKGRGERSVNEIRVPCVRRTGIPAKLLGRLIGRTSYVAEQLSSFPYVVSCIRRLRPQVVFYSDSNLGFQLYRWRKQIGIPFRLLFSNGGPCRPPFDRTDFVHQVAPLYQEQAIQAGESASKHFMVPYGIKICDVPLSSPEARTALRKRFSMPVDRPVVLSVGWISSRHKRMHYAVEELARLPKPRPFLQMLGAMDKFSQEIVSLAGRLLGPDGFSAKSVPYEEVFDYYRAADIFALASLQEGFGRVYLEALMHGLPVIAHRHPVMEYVLGGQGYLGDLNREGELAGILSKLLLEPQNENKQRSRWMSVRDRFSWPVLAPQYADMFAAVANTQTKTHRSKPNTVAELSTNLIL